MELGLKGRVIKTSLFQLSQNPVVQLKKLSEEEILLHTKRTSVQDHRLCSWSSSRRTKYPGTYADFEEQNCVFGGDSQSRKRSRSCMPDDEDYQSSQKSSKKMNSSFHQKKSSDRQSVGVMSDSFDERNQYTWKSYCAEMNKRKGKKTPSSEPKDSDKSHHQSTDSSDLVERGANKMSKGVTENEVHSKDSGHLCSETSKSCIRGKSSDQCFVKSKGNFQLQCSKVMHPICETNKATTSTSAKRKGVNVGCFSFNDESEGFKVSQSSGKSKVARTTSDSKRLVDADSKKDRITKELFAGKTDRSKVKPQKVVDIIKATDNLDSDLGVPGPSSYKSKGAVGSTRLNWDLGCFNISGTNIKKDRPKTVTQSDSRQVPKIRLIELFENSEIAPLNSENKGSKVTRTSSKEHGQKNGSATQPKSGNICFKQTEINRREHKQKSRIDESFSENESSKHPTTNSKECKEKYGSVAQSNLEHSKSFNVTKTNSKENRQKYGSESRSGSEQDSFKALDSSKQCKQKYGSTAQSALHESVEPLDTSSKEYKQKCGSDSQSGSELNNSSTGIKTYSKEHRQKLGSSSLSGSDHESFKVPESSSKERKQKSESDSRSGSENEVFKESKSSSKAYRHKSLEAVLFGSELESFKVLGKSNKEHKHKSGSASSSGSEHASLKVLDKSSKERKQKSGSASQSEKDRKHKSISTSRSGSDHESFKSADKNGKERKQKCASDSRSGLDHQSFNVPKTSSKEHRQKYVSDSQPGSEHEGFEEPRSSSKESRQKRLEAVLFGTEVEVAKVLSNKKKTNDMGRSISVDSSCLELSLSESSALNVKRFIENVTEFDTKSESCTSSKNTVSKKGLSVLENSFKKDVRNVSNQINKRCISEDKCRTSTSIKKSDNIGVKSLGTSEQMNDRCGNTENKSTQKPDSIVTGNLPQLTNGIDTTRVNVESLSRHDLPSIAEEKDNLPVKARGTLTNNLLQLTKEMNNTPVNLQGKSRHSVPQLTKEIGKRSVDTKNTSCHNLLKLKKGTDNRFLKLKDGSSYDLPKCTKERDNKSIDKEGKSVDGVLQLTKEMDKTRPVNLEGGSFSHDSLRLTKEMDHKPANLKEKSGRGLPELTKEMEKSCAASDSNCERTVSTMTNYDLLHRHACSSESEASRSPPLQTKYVGGRCVAPASTLLQMIQPREDVGASEVACSDSGLSGGKALLNVDVHLKLETNRSEKETLVHEQTNNNAKRKTQDHVTGMFNRELNSEETAVAEYSLQVNTEFEQVRIPIQVTSDDEKQCERRKITKSWRKSAELNECEEVGIKIKSDTTQDLGIKKEMKIRIPDTETPFCSPTRGGESEMNVTRDAQSKESSQERVCIAVDAGLQVTTEDGVFKKIYESSNKKEENIAMNRSKMGSKDERGTDSECAYSPVAKKKCVEPAHVEEKCSSLDDALEVTDELEKIGVETTGNICKTTEELLVVESARDITEPNCPQTTHSVVCSLPSSKQSAAAEKQTDQLGSTNSLYLRFADRIQGHRGDGESSVSLGIMKEESPWKLHKIDMNPMIYCGVDKRRKSECVSPVRYKDDKMERSRSVPIAGSTVSLSEIVVDSLPVQDVVSNRNSRVILRETVVDVENQDTTNDQPRSISSPDIDVRAGNHPTQLQHVFSRTVQDVKNSMERYKVSRECSRSVPIAGSSVGVPGIVLDSLPVQDVISNQNSREILREAVVHEENRNTINNNESRNISSPDLVSSAGIQRTRLPQSLSLTVQEIQDSIIRTLLESNSSRPEDRNANSETTAGRASQQKELCDSLRPYRSCSSVDVTPRVRVTINTSHSEEPSQRAVPPPSSASGSQNADRPIPLPDVATPCMQNIQNAGPSMMATSLSNEHVTESELNGNVQEKALVREPSQLNSSSNTVQVQETTNTKAQSNRTSVISSVLCNDTESNERTSEAVTSQTTTWHIPSSGLTVKSLSVISESSSISIESLSNNASKLVSNEREVSVISNNDQSATYHDQATENTNQPEVICDDPASTGKRKINVLSDDSSTQTLKKQKNSHSYSGTIRVKNLESLVDSLHLRKETAALVQQNTPINRNKSACLENKSPEACKVDEREELLNMINKQGVFFSLDSLRDIHQLISNMSSGTVKHFISLSNLIMNMLQYMKCVHITLYRAFPIHDDTHRHLRIIQVWQAMKNEFATKLDSLDFLYKDLSSYFQKFLCGVLACYINHKCDDEHQTDQSIYKFLKYLYKVSNLEEKNNTVNPSNNTVPVQISTTVLSDGWNSTSMRNQNQQQKGGNIAVCVPNRRDKNNDGNSNVPNITISAQNADRNLNVSNITIRSQNAVLISIPQDTGMNVGPAATARQQPATEIISSQPGQNVTGEQYGVLSYRQENYQQVPAVSDFRYSVPSLGTTTTNQTIQSAPTIPQQSNMYQQRSNANLLTGCYLPQYEQQQLPNQEIRVGGAPNYQASMETRQPQYAAQQRGNSTALCVQQLPNQSRISTNQLLNYNNLQISQPQYPSVFQTYPIAGSVNPNQLPELYFSHLMGRNVTNPSAGNQFNVPLATRTMPSQYQSNYPVLQNSAQIPAIRPNPPPYQNWNSSSNNTGLQQYQSSAENNERMHQQDRPAQTLSDAGRNRSVYEPNTRALKRLLAERAKKDKRVNAEGQKNNTSTLTQCNPLNQNSNLPLTLSLIKAPANQAKSNVHKSPVTRNPNALVSPNSEPRNPVASQPPVTTSHLVQRDANMSSCALSNQISARHPSGGYSASQTSTTKNNHSGSVQTINTQSDLLSREFVPVSNVQSLPLGNSVPPRLNNETRNPVASQQKQQKHQPCLLRKNTQREVNCPPSAALSNQTSTLFPTGVSSTSQNNSPVQASNTDASNRITQELGTKSSNRSLAQWQSKPVWQQLPPRPSSEARNPNASQQKQDCQPSVTGHNQLDVQQRKVHPSSGELSYKAGGLLPTRVSSQIKGPVLASNTGASNQLVANSLVVSNIRSSAQLVPESVCQMTPRVSSESRNPLASQQKQNYRPSSIENYQLDPCQREVNLRSSGELSHQLSTAKESSTSQNSAVQASNTGTSNQITSEFGTISNVYSLSQWKPNTLCDVTASNTRASQQNQNEQPSVMGNYQLDLRQREVNLRSSGELSHKLITAKESSTSKNSPVRASNTGTSNQIVSEFGTISNICSLAQQNPDALCDLTASNTRASQQKQNDQPSVMGNYQLNLRQREVNRRSSEELSQLLNTVKESSTSENNSAEQASDTGTSNQIVSEFGTISNICSLAQWNPDAPCEDATASNTLASQQNQNEQPSITGSDQSDHKRRGVKRRSSKELSYQTSTSTHQNKSLKLASEPSVEMTSELGTICDVRSLAQWVSKSVSSETSEARNSIASQEDRQPSVTTSNQLGIQQREVICWPSNELSNQTIPVLPTTAGLFASQNNVILDNCSGPAEVSVSQHEISVFEPVSSNNLVPGSSIYTSEQHSTELVSHTSPVEVNQNESKQELEPSGDGEPSDSEVEFIYSSASNPEPVIIVLDDDDLEEGMEDSRDSGYTTPSAVHNSKNNDEDSDTEVLCKTCDKVAVVICSGCRVVCYCSESCQLADWEAIHYRECQPQ